jgi:molybdopterin molybdotransferase
MGIATGGVVPEGADSVVPYEEAVGVIDNEIEITHAVPLGANIRSQGGDVRAGEVVVAAGVRLDGSRLGALAAAGVAEIECSRRPRVGIVTTGSELQRPGEPLAPGHVYESNGVLLSALLRLAGADVDDAVVVADDREAHRRALEDGLRRDVLVTSGGVSVGPHDLVREVGEELGLKQVFWGVAIRPGKPVFFAVGAETLVFGLPGNPVSSLVGCRLFVEPAVLALQGLIDPRPLFLPGRLGIEVRRDPRRDEMLRARLEVEPEGVVAFPLEAQDSHMIVRSASADALVLVRAGTGVVRAGALVSYLPLR